MAPVACVAAPRAPHGSQHGPNSCNVTPLLLPGRPDVSRHFVLQHVMLHVPASCTVTPRASLDTQLVRQLPPRSYPF
ncbi:hypothetical protein F2Q68_00018835 [Brassica cretica]|uniref:Uncharacterized protein n=1 Tax=Brassica cretica TaxID=69181 RepID=A0A8S9FUG9_BRACR|nr:hypothetical protein F2Q68_00018835 [Brassica cretica]